MYFYFYLYTYIHILLDTYLFLYTNIWYTYINLTIRNTPIFIHVHFHDCGRKGSLLSEENWKEEQIQGLQCMSLFGWVLNSWH